MEIEGGTFKKTYKQDAILVTKPYQGLHLVTREILSRSFLFGFTQPQKL